MNDGSNAVIRAPSRSWGPFSGNQLTVILCTLIVMILFPVGAWAVTGNNVFVTDPATGAHAHIDAYSGLVATLHDPRTGKAASVNSAGQLVVNATGSVNVMPSHQYNNLSFEGGDEVVSPANPFADLFQTTTAQRFSITSLTFTNETSGTAAEVELWHFLNGSGTSGNCAQPGGLNVAERMLFQVPASATTHVTFPTPLTWASFQQAGHLDCFDIALVSGGSNGVDVLANGFVNN